MGSRHRSSSRSNLTPFRPHRQFAPLKNPMQPSTSKLPQNKLCTKIELQHMKNLLIPLFLACTAILPMSLLAQAHLPVFESKGEQSIIYGFDAEGYPLQANGDKIEKKRFSIGKWIVVQSPDASPSTVTAQIENLSIKVEQTLFGVTSYYSYNFRFRPSALCRPYGILTAKSKNGKNTISEGFRLDGLEAPDSDGWLNVSVEVGVSGNPADYDFQCNLFEQNNEILLSSDSPSTFLPAEPQADPEGNRPPSVILTVYPQIPKNVDKKGKEVSALIEAVINKDGKVSRAKVSKTNNYQYGEQAKIAVESTRFYPALLKGKPTPVKIRLPLQYTPSN